MSRPEDEFPGIRCRECTRWYGAEDDELGPCMLKHARGEARFLTHGAHECDEPENIAEYRARWEEERRARRIPAGAESPRPGDRGVNGA